MWWSISHWGEGLLRARSNGRHAVAVTLPIVGEPNKIKKKITKSANGQLERKLVAVAIVRVSRGILAQKNRKIGNLGLRK